ncbi:hypothetical protein B0H14DRAFT_2565249 [Mycena olivaceomarginata]|nr:hypothetical protein B0H14DRAFT_2565249 [Mycena olivaceomarginata]
MSRHPLRALGDSAELDYTTFGFDQSVHGRVWLLRANNVLQSNDMLLLPCWTRYIALSANITVAVYNLGNLDHESTDIPDSCVKMLQARTSLYRSEVGHRRIIVSANLANVLTFYESSASSTRTDNFSGSGTRPVPLKWTDLWDWVILVGLDGSPKWDWSQIDQIVGLMHFSESVAHACRIDAHHEENLIHRVNGKSHSLRRIPLFQSMGVGLGTISGTALATLSVPLVLRLMLNLHEAGAGQIDTNTFNMEPIRFTGGA